MARLSFRTRIAGRSICGVAIESYEFGPLSRPTLIIGGFHGDEPKSVYVARRLVEELQNPSREAKPSAPETPCLAQGVLIASNVVVVPLLNPDGYAERRRKNARGVDLNRNFPTKNWAVSPKRRRYHGGPEPASEPETRALIRLIQRLRPRQIITIHSIDRHRHCNNYDGPGRRLANLLARYNRYPVVASIGYPTPGSFGAWAGIENRISTVTLELPSHHSPQRCWTDNRLALLTAAQT